MGDRTEGDPRSRVREAETRFDDLITVEADRTTTGGPLSFPVVAFGRGSTPLVIVPGLSDGLTTVEGKGRMMAGEYGALMRDTMRRTYTPRYLRRYRLMMPFLGLIGRPKSFRRFLIQADSCMNHDATESLNSIRTPTLVVGGGSDEIVGRGTSERLAELIPAAELEIYPELGHGAFEEAGECTERIMRFFRGTRDTNSPCRAAQTSTDAGITP